MAAFEKAHAAMDKKILALGREDFVLALVQFMHKRGTPLYMDKLPILAKRPLDLYKLFKYVTERGGYEVVSVRE